MSEIKKEFDRYKADSEQAVSSIMPILNGLSVKQAKEVLSSVEHRIGFFKLNSITNSN